ncbi:UNVERIFIED_CONTAM: hypothetical protein FKN15_050598 [Acipenser sinensis]
MSAEPPWIKNWLKATARQKSSWPQLPVNLKVTEHCLVIQKGRVPDLDALHTMTAKWS